MGEIKLIQELVETGRGKRVCEEIQKAMAAGISAVDILQQGMLPAMSSIGVKFKNNEVFVPEVLVAARAMNMGMALLNPHVVADGFQPEGVAVIGTVRGDMHDIGKNLVRMFMEGSGLKVIDLGVDVLPQRFLEAAQAHQADLICCSALLTTTMNEIKVILRMLDEAGLRERYTVMIGGAPVTQSFCDAVGADIFTPDAATAAEVALEICRKKRRK